MPDQPGLGLYADPDPPPETLYQGGADRYHVKRQAGLSSKRSDGSRADPETDRQAAAAEDFAARFLGSHFEGAVVAVQPEKGWDFSICIGSQEFTVQVVWNGWANKSKRKPRSWNDGRLIINLYEQHRHADIYVLVAGSVETKFTLSGWIVHDYLMNEGTDYKAGYSGKKISFPAYALWPPKILHSLIRQGKGHGPD